MSNLTANMKSAIRGLFSESALRFFGIQNVDMDLAQWLSDLYDRAMGGQLLADILFQKEANHSISVDASTSENTRGGDLTIKSGDGRCAEPGHVKIDTGTGNCLAWIKIGDCNAGDVRLGRCGQTVKMEGAARVAEALEVCGCTNLHDLTATCVHVTNDLSVCGNIKPEADVVLKKEMCHTIKVDQSSCCDAPGGDLNVEAGAGNGSGAAGHLRLGVCNTSCIEIGACGKQTNVQGRLSVAEHAEFAGSVKMCGSSFTPPTVADGACKGGVPMVFRLTLASGVNQDQTITVDEKVRIIDAWVIMKGAGTAGSRVTLKNNGFAVTESLDLCNACDKDKVGFRKFDDDYQEINCGNPLTFCHVSDGGDFPGAEAYVHCLHVA